MRVAIRALRADDAAAVVAAYERTHEHDPTVGAISLTGWRRFVALPQNQGGRDFRVAIAAGRVVGVATASLRRFARPWIRHFRIVVEPAWRRRGIARALLANVAALDPEPEIWMQTLCPRDWIAGAAFLDAMDFAVIENEIDMACERLAPPPPAAAAIRRISDPAPLAAALAAIHNRAYAGTVSFVQLSAGEMHEVLTDGAMVWIAEADERIAAFCHLEREGRQIRLESLAVDPARQRSGLGAALAHRALSEAGAGAVTRANLSVSDHNVAAIRLYRRLGFNAVFSAARYRAAGARIRALTAQSAAAHIG